MDLSQTETKLTLQLLRKNVSGMVGTGLVVFVLLIMIIGSFIVPHDPIKPNMNDRLLSPNPTYLLGTDNLGRDILSRILDGLKYTLGSSIVAVLITVSIGTIIGLIAGYIGGIVDEIIMRVTDIFLAFPSLILAMAISVQLKPSLVNAIIALVATGWPGYARLVRGSVLSIREKLYVKAAIATGESNSNIIFLHILPNTFTPILVRATLQIGGVILAIAGLGFIGAGAQAPMPELGAMVAVGRQYILSHYWISLFPGIAIIIIVFGFNLLGDALRDILDPRIRYQ